MKLTGIELRQSNLGIIEVRYDGRKYSINEFMRLASKNGIEGRVSFVASSSADYEIMKNITKKLEKIIVKKARDRNI